MGQADAGISGLNASSEALGLAEIELRRYQARLSVWKVVLGTFIVGLAGIIIPAAINLTTLFFQDWRARAELDLAKQSAHQQYIKDFYDTAVNQDIELRIRFAHYFANLSDGAQKQLWETYLTELVGQRNDIRNRINDLEEQLVDLQQAELTPSNVVRLDRIARELNWSYSEIGYVPLDRSVVQVVPGKKERLYNETLDVVGRLAGSEQAIDPDSRDYRRFWELYRRDLIGVESRAVATKMIQIGRELDQLASAGQPASAVLRRLSDELASQIDLERKFANSGGAEQQLVFPPQQQQQLKMNPVQQQQQQQLQQIQENPVQQQQQQQVPLQ